MNQTDRPAKEPVRIRNRDIVLLSRVLYTMQDVNATEQKRMWQQDRLFNITAKLTGMPNGKGGGGGLEQCFAEISEIEERYEAECTEYLDELKQAEDILNSIQSRTMRTFVTMRYVLGLSNKDVMGQLNLTRWKFDSMCRCIEDAEDMESVQWDEKYGT